LVAGTALVLISGNAQAATISDSRLLAQRELAFSFQNTPDMFLVTVLNAKDKYGIETVSSVIYEKQKDYYPLFANQLQVMSDPKGKECLKLLVQGNNKSAEQNKAALVSDLKF
jgi:beta-galactosidase/beta-glucuronidase